ncbi:hypothetical protein, partial [Devosia sp.]|uniref:hypothetical protein n=1 Tax=Devosia sp. TaxID=1871048 RepID=UPI002AFF097C
MNSITLETIQRRRAEVGKQLSDLDALRAELESELGDLAATERTFARMGGAERITASAPVGQPEAVARGDATKPATTTEMILQVFREMGRGMEPREVTDAIEAKGWGPVNRDALRTRIWHLAKDKKLAK